MCNSSAVAAQRQASGGCGVRSKRLEALCMRYTRTQDSANKQTPPLVTSTAPCRECMRDVQMGVDDFVVRSCPLPVQHSTPFAVYQHDLAPFVVSQPSNKA